MTPLGIVGDYVHYAFTAKCVCYTSCEYGFSHVVVVVVVVTINICRPGALLRLHRSRVHVLSILRLASRGHLN